MLAGLGRKIIFSATRMAALANTVASASLSMRDAIQLPRRAPARTKIAQRLTMSKSTASRE
jgi:hypothetical protein